MPISKVPNDPSLSREMRKFLDDLSKAALSNNLAGEAAPAVTDDADAGYRIGSLWIDVTNDDAYICVDATADAAVWVQIN